MKYYVAYGSNINIEQMIRRCPTAEVIGTGWIDGQELVFGGRCTNAVATLRPLRDSQVPVLVWKVGETDEDALDFYEGYPRFYRKEMVTVRMDGGRKIECMIYLLNPEIRGIPSSMYVDVIREGYEECGMDEAYLDQAIRKAKQSFIKTWQT